jgi:hypothetical protein
MMMSRSARNGRNATQTSFTFYAPADVFLSHSVIAAGTQCARGASPGARHVRTDAAKPPKHFLHGSFRKVRRCERCDHKNHTTTHTIRDRNKAYREHKATYRRRRCTRRLM